MFYIDLSMVDSAKCSQLEKDLTYATHLDNDSLWSMLDILGVELKNIIVSIFNKFQVLKLLHNKTVSLT